MKKLGFFGEDTDFIEVFDLNLNHTQTIILDPQIRGQKMSFASKGNDAFYITNPLGNVVHLVDLDCSRDLERPSYNSKWNLHCWVVTRLLPLRQLVFMNLSGTSKYLKTVRRCVP